jgi:hypothetical protein
MNLRFAYLLGLLLTGAAARAQVGTLGQEGAAAQANLAALVSGAPTVLPRGGNEEVVGSPYVDNRWLLARITLRTNKPLAPVPLKYNLLEQRLLMRTLQRPKDSLQLDDRLVTGFVLEEPASPAGPARQRPFRRFAEAPLPKHRADFAEVLHQGRYTLLKHHLKTLKKADYQGAYSTDRRQHEIETRAVYYLRTPNGTLAPVKLSLKALQTAAPALAQALKTAADSREPNSEADWAAVLGTVDPPAK